MSGTGRAWTELASQHLSLDDLNGFPSVTKNVHFLSPWHSPPQPPDTIDFVLPFHLLPVHSLTPCFLWMSGVSEWVRKCERERKKKIQCQFYYAYVVCLYECVCLNEYQCHCTVARYSCYSNGWSTASIMKHFCRLWAQGHLTALATSLNVQPFVLR